MAAAFRILPQDNVATMLADAAPGIVSVTGGEAVVANEAVAHGHKIALVPIAPGAGIVKFGVAIGEATRAIVPGDWVHLHNCRSRYDARSGDFDLETGAAQDTPYA